MPLRFAGDGNVDWSSLTAQVKVRAMTPIMKNQTGQVLVELALVLPFLAMFVFGIFDFGRWMYGANTLNHAAGAGARAAAVMTTPLPTPVTSGRVDAPTNDMERAINLNLLSSKLTGSVTYDVQIIYSGGRTVGPTQAGDLVHVTVRWPTFQLVNPMLKSLYSPTVLGEATVRYE